MARVGYARVSSSGQKLDVQIDKLKQDGCERIFTEKWSGLDQTRPELKNCLDYLREGDTLVVTRLDRLARSATHLGQMVAMFESQKIGFVVLDQQINTAAPMGKFMFHMLAAFAEFEWHIRKERQADGIAKAKQKGIQLGRKVKITPEVSKAIQQDRLSGLKIAQLMNHYQLSKASVYRALRDNEML